MNKIINYVLILFLALSFSQLHAQEKNTNPNIRSLRAIVVNQKTGEVIYEKNSDAKASIASLTKLMTAMVVLDSHLDLSEEIKKVKKISNRTNIFIAYYIRNIRLIDNI